MKRTSLGLKTVNRGQFPPVYATPKDWHKPTGIHATCIGRGYYNYRSHCYVRR